MFSFSFYTVPCCYVVCGNLHFISRSLGKPPATAYPLTNFSESVDPAVTYSLSMG